MQQKNSGGPFGAARIVESACCCWTSTVAPAPLSNTRSKTRTRRRSWGRGRNCDVMRNRSLARLAAATVELFRRQLSISRSIASATYARSSSPTCRLIVATRSALARSTMGCRRAPSCSRRPGVGEQVDPLQHLHADLLGHGAPARILGRRGRRERRGRFQRRAEQRVFHRLGRARRVGGSAAASPDVSTARRLDAHQPRSSRPSRRLGRQFLGLRAAASSPPRVSTSSMIVSVLDARELRHRRLDVLERGGNARRRTTGGSFGGAGVAADRCCAPARSSSSNASSTSSGAVNSISSGSRARGGRSTGGGGGTAGTIAIESGASPMIDGSTAPELQPVGWLALLDDDALAPAASPERPVR